MVENIGDVHMAHWLWADVQVRRCTGVLAGWLTKQREQLLLALLMNVAKTRQFIMCKGFFQFKQRIGLVFHCSIWCSQ
jgi:hypothetical protein